MEAVKARRKEIMGSVVIAQKVSLMIQMRGAGGGGR